MPSKSYDINELADTIQNLELQCADLHKQLIENFHKKRNTMSSHNKRWLLEEEMVLEMLVEKGIPWAVISRIHGRTESATRSRWSHIRNRSPPEFVNSTKKPLVYQIPESDSYIAFFQQMENEKKLKARREQKLTDKHRHQKTNVEEKIQKGKLNDVTDDDEEDIQQISSSLEHLQVSKKEKHRSKHQQVQQPIQHQKHKPVNKNINLSSSKNNSSWSDEDDLLLIQLCAIKLPYKYISNRLSVKRTTAAISSRYSFLKSQGIGNLNDYYNHHGKPLDSSGIPDLKSLTLDENSE